MKRSNWLTILGLSFLTLSTVIFTIDYLIFRDAAYIFRYLLAALGFLPISVFLVTIVLNQLMGSREKNARMQKLNMVIGAFFSHVGTDLLKVFSISDLGSEQFGKDLRVNSYWSGEDFSRVKSKLEQIKLDVKVNSAYLEELQRFLTSKRDYFLRLLENPNLLEHETFSELLWAVFHLTEELDSRSDLKKLSTSDYSHLGGDIKRVYILLIAQWLDYMQHLNKNYPYLFSLAIRKNPFNPKASVEITETTAG